MDKIKLSIFLLLFFISCKENKDHLLFELKKSSYTKVDFTNTLNYTEELNPYTYRNFYNGGGVGVGDFNNDSLPDIFFLYKIKLIISEKVRLIIIKYDIGFVSLFIVLLKLNKSKAIKIDAIIGRPGISQVKFNNIIIKQA